MADNVKEVNPAPPTPNSDDNRRRTRSQTRNGGVTPPAPVVEPRGRKRGQSQPNSGAKRGRKPASAVKQPEEHSKLENQDLPQKYEAHTKEPKREADTKKGETDIEMKPADNEDEGPEDTLQKEKTTEEVTHTQADKQNDVVHSTKDEAVVEDVHEEEPKQVDESSRILDQPKQDEKPKRTDEQSESVDHPTQDESKSKAAEKPKSAAKFVEEKPVVEDQAKEVTTVEESKQEAQINNDTNVNSESKANVDEASKQLANDNVTKEKIVEESHTKEEKKEGGDNETAATETAQAIST